MNDASDKKATPQAPYVQKALQVPLSGDDAMAMLEMLGRGRKNRAEPTPQPHVEENEGSPWSS